MSIKNSFYFPHDSNAANDQKILKLRSKFNNAEGYGIYFMILEAMSQTSQGYLMAEPLAELSLSYSLSIKQLEKVMSFCVEIGLFVQDENGFYSKRMIEHLKFRQERSESGKRGAKTRWGMAEPLAEPMAELMQRKGKKRKEYKEKRIPYKSGKLNSIDWEKEQIVTAFKTHLSKDFKTKPIDEDSLLFWRETYSLEEIVTAIGKIQYDSFWKDIMTPTILFRRKDKSGNRVDYIGGLLNKKEY